MRGEQLVDTNVWAGTKQRYSWKHGVILVLCAPGSLSGIILLFQAECDRQVVCTENDIATPHPGVIT